MFRILDEVENNLSQLLDGSKWKSKKIDYSPPIVDRIYRDWDFEGVSYRIYMHRIYACDRAFFHPHPWPSAIRVIGAPNSTYEMGIGFSANERHDPPPHAAVIQVANGFKYEMTHPDGWHYVRIIGEPSISLMVSGPVWDRSAPRTEKYNFRELNDVEYNQLVEDVVDFYRV
jgi:hypothetical protein